MLKKTDETKVMRDPVHGYIHVDLQVVWDCINAKEFQRLRRIHQLGGNFQVYHTAEHSRFAHSLGVYEIVRRMVYEIAALNEQLSSYEKATVMLAGLLHDIGHGPFSHAFEAISICKHETFTERIILEDSEVHRVLASVDERLPEDVASIISHTHKNELLNQIVSGQLDADRMDYLLRDAYFTGTSYGNFDLERVIRTIRVKDNKIVVKESGMHTIEDYIMARYHMYWQVYYHPIARSYEGLLTILFDRMAYLYKHKPEMIQDLTMFLPFIEKREVSIEEHFILDENAAFYGFTLCTNKEDKILKDIASRLLNRKLFSYRTLDNENDKEKIKNVLMSLNYDPAYYLYEDSAMQRPYKPYKMEGKGQNIYVLTDKDEIVELSEISAIVKAVANGNLKEDHKIFYPEEIEDRL